MKNLINIATEEQPLFIDPASVTAMHVYLEKNALVFHNEKGVMLGIDYKSHGINPDKILQKLADAGNVLVAFPIREAFARYIAPSAVTYATVTKVTERGDINTIIGIKGAGRIQTYGIQPEEFQALLDGIKAAGKTMLEYTPDVACAGWYNAAMLYIDPIAITSIRDDGMQVNVHFGASDVLDVQARPANSEEEPGSLASAFAARDEAARRGCRELAADIAAANGTLTQVINTLQRGIYVHPENIDYVTFYDDKKDTQPESKYEMRLHSQKAGSNFSDTVNVYFNSAAARVESFKILTGAKTPNAPKKDPGLTS